MVVAPCGADSVRLEVVDNGPGRAAPPGVKPTGSGLLGLQERARALGGAVAAARTRDGGYRLSVTLPATGRRDGLGAGLAAP